MGFFTWLTEGVCRAIVRGVEQAADEINAAGTDVEIRLRLPAHTEPARLEEPTNGKRRKVHA